MIRKFALVFLAFFSLKSFAVTPQMLLEKQGTIWALEFLDENEILFTEREGKLKIFNVATKNVQPIQSSLAVDVGGQGGLLDVGLHPDFKKNNLIYFTYSCAKPGGNTTCLGRAQLLRKDGKASLEKLEELFAVQPVVDSRHHFGSRLAWDKSGYLFMSTGERYSRRDLAQKLDNHLGKIIRFDLDNKSEIWSYGHRNIQGLAFDDKGQLWSQEHGARGGDEINKIEKGKNYGWPVITHGRDYSGLKIGEGKSKAGMEQPFYHFTPSIAPSGLLIYSGKKFKDWRGDMFSGALALTHLNHLIIKDGKPVREERLFKELGERVRDVKESPAGEIYFSTDSGKIFKIVP